jgi:divalent metal cation (Fe/Co/Zn/Cd) transporter
MHVLVPGRWTVQQGHDLSEKIEKDLAEALPQSTSFIHIGSGPADRRSREE